MESQRRIDFVSTACAKGLRNVKVKKEELVVENGSPNVGTEHEEINTAGQTTGSPCSKYKHRRKSTWLHDIRNIRICMEKKNLSFP